MNYFLEKIRKFFFQNTYSEDFKTAIQGALVHADTNLFQDDTIFRVTRLKYNNPRTETGFDSRWYGEQSNAESYSGSDRDLMTSNKIKSGYHFICLSFVILPNNILNINLLKIIFKHMINVLYNKGIIDNSGKFKHMKQSIYMENIADAYGIICNGREIPDKGHTGTRNSNVLLDRIFVSELMQIVKSFIEFDSVIGIFTHKITFKKNKNFVFFDKECTILNGYRENALIEEKRYVRRYVGTNSSNWELSKGGGGSSSSFQFLNNLPSIKRKRTSQDISVVKRQKQSVIDIDNFNEHIKNLVILSFQFQNNKKNEKEYQKYYNDIVNKMIIERDEIYKLYPTDENVRKYLQLYFPYPLDNDDVKGGSKSKKNKRTKNKRTKKNNS